MGVTDSCIYLLTSPVPTACTSLDLVDIGFKSSLSGVFILSVLVMSFSLS